jgi:PAS domain S-box-containing protein
MSELPLKVLIVDDELHIRELLRSFLESRGMSVQAVETADDALALPDLAAIEVALLDIQLPGRDGHELQQELNNRFPGMAKILMSGQADLDDVIAAFSDQAFTFIKKPFSSLKEIAILVERAAETKRLEQQNRDYARRLEAHNVALTETVVERTVETQRYQRILEHLFLISSEIGRKEPASRLLDFVCQAVVEAGAFRRAALLLADTRFRVRQVGLWEEDGDETRRDPLRAFIDQPLRPYEFDRDEEHIGSAIYARAPRGAKGTVESLDQWQAGDRLILPMFREDGGVFGYLSLDGPADGACPAQKIVRLMEVLLGHGALQLESHDLRDRLQQDSVDLKRRIEERSQQLRLSEERFSGLVNATTDIVYFTDEQDRLTYLNDAFTRVLGYMRDSYLGRTLRRLLEDLMTENPINPRALQELASREADHAVVHVELVTRQGDKRTLEINRTVVRQDGAVHSTQGILRDITEHRVLLQQLVTAERLAATGRLAAGVAHEINNPLQAMVTQIKVAQDKAAAHEDPTDSLHAIELGVERLRYIVSGMLNMQRAPQETAVVSLNDVAEAVAALIKPQVSGHNVRLSLNLEPQLPPVTASPQELQQVALNLMLNAIDAMPQGGDLYISTRSLPQIVELTVRDTGVGIAAEHLPQIFEPFFTFRASGQGTGLGLYLSRNMIEGAGGKISVESEKGKGAAFTVSLPRR